MKVALVIIDPQKDFCQPANELLANAMITANHGITTPNISFVNDGGALFVPGADQDCIRLATMINRLKNKIDAIHVTLDSHHEADIAHPIFWRDNNGENPAPFTIISKEDVVSGRFTTTNPSCLKRATEYVTALETNQRYPLCIWPPHCRIGTDGHAMEENVSKAVCEWGRDRLKPVNFVTKGSNPWTEHYSAVKADVPDPKDATTLPNSNLITTIDEADIIAIAGQALSHCVANTVMDLIDQFGPESVRKIVLLRDTCSNVTGFEQNGEDFITRATAQGMRVDSSTNFLA